MGKLSGSLRYNASRWCSWGNAHIQRPLPRIVAKGIIWPSMISTAYYLALRVLFYSPQQCARYLKVWRMTCSLPQKAYNNFKKAKRQKEERDEEVVRKRGAPGIREYGNSAVYPACFSYTFACGWVGAGGVCTLYTVIINKVEY